MSDNFRGEQYAEPLLPPATLYALPPEQRDAVMSRVLQHPIREWAFVQAYSVFMQLILGKNLQFSSFVNNNSLFLQLQAVVDFCIWQEN